ncbi:hypothetical protein J6590_016457, partial [Homalodisca vitripennis]
RSKHHACDPSKEDFLADYMRFAAPPIYFAYRLHFTICTSARMMKSSLPLEDLSLHKVSSFDHCYYGRVCGTRSRRAPQCPQPGHTEPPIHNLGPSCSNKLITPYKDPYSLSPILFD